MSALCNPLLWPCTTPTLAEPVCFTTYTGNLTKHMKSKAHSKKCMEMGVAIGVIDDHDTEDSGTTNIKLTDDLC